MLIKPDKPPFQTTSYQPISLLSAIMKLFEWVIEKRLRKHLEDNGFFSKYQSGFRKAKLTNNHLFRLCQTIMENFNQGKHVIAAFLEVEKALFYVNQLGPNRHTREDPVHDTSDILDMAFITPGLSSRDISFSVADDHMGSDKRLAQWTQV